LEDEQTCEKAPLDLLETDVPPEWEQFMAPPPSQVLEVQSPEMTTVVEPLTLVVAPVPAEMSCAATREMPAEEVLTTTNSTPAAMARKIPMLTTNRFVPGCELTLAPLHCQTC
jgi:hypothetical protein